MTIDSKFILRQIRDLFFFFLAALGQTLLICVKCNGFPEYVRVVAFTFLMWLMLWKGNSFLASWISTRISWIKFPVKRFFVGIVCTIGYTVGIMVVIMMIFEYFFNLNFGRSYIFTIYGSVVITILISFFLHARAFLISWRHAIVDKEKFEKESITARYESLKNQVNPHFLFNSLNALTNLVYEDQDKAVKFIKQLSEVYRYVLDTREMEVVPLAQELRFIDSYLYLQQIRFGDKLIIKTELSDRSFYVTPLALQLLIENAIKHNVVSSDEPLIIRIFQQGEYLCVENNRQKKRIPLEPSAGIGLENIQRRYEMLTDKKVVIEETDASFIVRIPQLQNVSA
jgi:hypothetical protein